MCLADRVLILYSRNRNNNILRLLVTRGFLCNDLLRVFYSYLFHSFFPQLRIILRHLVMVYPSFLHHFNGIKFPIIHFYQILKFLLGSKALTSNTRFLNSLLYKVGSCQD